MPHIHYHGTGMMGSEDGKRECTFTVYFQPVLPAETFIVELDYRAVAAVMPIPGPVLEYAQGVASGAHPTSLKSWMQYMGIDFGQEIAGAPAHIELTPFHNEGSLYHATGLRGANRNGKFTITGVAWTYNAMTGITGDPLQPVDALMITSSAKQELDIAWEKGEYVR